MRARRVVFVEFAPSGGLYQFTAQLAAALAARGTEVHLFTGPDPELVPEQSGLTVHPVLPTWHPGDDRVRARWVRKARRGVRAGQLVLAWLVLLRHLRALRPDVVLWSTLRFSIDTIGVLAVDRLLPATMVGMIAHEPRPMSAADTTAFKRGRVLEPTLAAAWRRMGVAFVLGDEAEALLRRSWRPAGPVVVVPHGDESAVRGDAPVPPVDATGPVALFFGTWSAYKGIDVLLDAWTDVRRQVPDARLVLAGAVARVDLDGLLDRARAIGGIDARPGYVPLDAVPALFGAARVVVVPYRRASQSGVAHLAYAFSRPVVASAVGDIPTVVRDGETGLTVPPDDPAALAKALVDLLGDADRAQRLGAAGAARLAATASWPTVAEAVDGGLTRALEQRAARRQRPGSTDS